MRKKMKKSREELIKEIEAMAKAAGEQIIRFVRDDEHGRASCTVYAGEDGAYVLGDDIEVIFEFSPDSAENAIKCVEEHGYVRCPES